MKKFMKTKAVFLSIIVLAFAANVIAQKQRATAFVESFYKFHRSRSTVFDVKELNFRKKWFTSELNRLFQNELKREKEYLKANPTDKPFFGDGFPFTPYEECYKNKKEIKNVLKVGNAVAVKNRTIVNVKFYYPKVCSGKLNAEYKVEIVKKKGRWQINDFIYSDGSRLTEDLKRPQY